MTLIYADVIKHHLSALSRYAEVAVHYETHHQKVYTLLDISNQLGLATISSNTTEFNLGLTM